MQEKFRDKIKQNFVELVENIEPDTLVEYLVSKKILKKFDVKKIFADKTDYRHANRLILFRILRKSDAVYHHFVDGLEKFGLKHLLVSINYIPGAQSNKVFHEANNDIEQLIPIPALSLETVNASIESPDLPTTKNQSTKRETLVVRVKCSEQFHNQSGNDVYETKSKRRGQVLLINNKYFGVHHKVRKGSEVDVKCLIDLFEQMFMKVEYHQELLKSDMERVITRFAQFDADRISDICIVIIMSHGEEKEKELTVIDRLNEGLQTSWIEEQFNNVYCSWLEGKPKVFLYQLCRGRQHDYATTRIREKDSPSMEISMTDKTETDKIQHHNDSIESDSGNILQIERRLDDMLVGYATLRGRKAHRDPEIGSWYIQLICEIFMERSHNSHIIQMLNEVDRRLKLRASSLFTMQTSSYTSYGFNKLLYFNPGIYMDEDGNVQKFI